MQNLLTKGVAKKETKKDHTNIIICPRCGAGNIAAQGSCGRCGLVFPKDKARFKGRKGEWPVGEENSRPSPTIPASLPGAPRGMIPQMPEQMVEGDQPDDQPKPTRPKQLPEKGATEGISKEAGQALSCPRCGMDTKADAKRCPHCGYKK